MDDTDGTFRCDAFYGLDSNLNPIPSYNQDLLDEHYALESLLKHIEKAVKTNDSLYGDIVMVLRQKFDPHYLSVIEGVCGRISYAVLIPINGPNRSYGLLRVLYRQKDDNPSRTLIISPKDLVFLGMTSSAISSVIRDFKKQYEQELLLVMQDSILNWYQHKEQALKENYVCIRAILANVTKYLVVDQNGPAKAATIRLFYQKTQAVSVSHWTRHNKGLKDQLQRDISNPDCILAKVANNACDLLIPNVAKHEYFSKFENKQWIIDNEFRDFFCLSLNFKGFSFGTLSIYTGKYQIVSLEDRRFLRAIANCLAFYISLVFLHEDKSEDASSSLVLDKFLKNVYSNPLEMQLESKSIYISASVHDESTANNLKNGLMDKGLLASTSLERYETNNNFSFDSASSLSNSNVIIVIVSSNSLDDIVHQQSEWSEICMLRWTHHKSLIIPVQIDDACLPRFINVLPSIHITSSTSPIFLIDKVLEYINDAENRSDKWTDHSNRDEQRKVLKDFMNSIQC
jgi:hypothetical protein